MVYRLRSFSEFRIDVSNLSLIQSHKFADQSIKTPSKSLFLLSMDTKSLARSKRAHSNQHKRTHPRQKPKSQPIAVPSDPNSKNPPGKQNQEKPRQFLCSSSVLPSNWDRYEDEFDTTSESSSVEPKGQAADVVHPKSKGADFSYLISEAQSQLESRRGVNSGNFTSFDDVLPGSFSRSAVNHESGAKTGLSGLTMGIIMGCALLFMTPLFREIPQCALAAIVISAVLGLVDYDEAIFLWRVNKKDFLLWTITSVTTLFLGIEIGVLVGVGFSLAFVIHESTNPHIAVLGRLPGTTIYRNTQQYPEAYTYNGIVVVRIDAPIYFANISYIKYRLREYEVDSDGATKRGPEVERIYFVILEMALVTYIDSSAIQALKDLHQKYKSRDIQMAVANPNREVLLTLANAGVVDLIGKEWCFMRVHDVVQVCLQNVPSLKGTPETSENKPSFFQRLHRPGDDVLESGDQDACLKDREAGERQPSALRRLMKQEGITETNSQTEPLLSWKP